MIRHLALILALICSQGLVRGGSCSYSLSPNNAAPAVIGGPASFNVMVGNTCAWTAATTNSWLHTLSSGVGNGTVLYTVDPNLAFSARSGAITVGGQTFIVNQTGAPVPLGVALDNTNLVWQTASDYPWYATNPPAPSFDGVNSAVSGNRYVANSVSWLQTTVVGPGTLSFWWKVDSDVYPPPPDPPSSFDYLEFDINGEAQDAIMGLVDWNYRSYAIPPGTNVVTWQYVKDPQYNSAGDRAWLDQVSYTTNTPMPLSQALNTCGVGWTTGGNTNATYWAGQTNVSHDGRSAAQSGSVFMNQESWLQATVIGATNVSFCWKVSSQTNYDFLEFYTNGARALRISGEVNWQSNSFRLSGATNVLKWRYARTNAVFVAQGQNCGWLDQVVISPPTRAFPYTLTPPSPQPDGSLQLGVTGEVGCNCQLQYSTDLANWTPLTNFLTTDLSTAIADPGAANSPVRFYRAVSR